MKQLLLICLLLMLFRVLMAPEAPRLLIERAERLDPYKRIVTAIGWVESRHDTLAYNAFEEATGYFQIRPVRLRDYNRQSGDSLKMKDMFNYPLAVKVFMFYARQIGWRDPERISREWNAGPNGMKFRQTKEYWNKIKAIL